MPWGDNTSWSNTLSAEQVAACQKLLPVNQVSSGRRMRGDRPREGWSVRMSPTTGQPTELEVICRDRFGKVLSVYPVMVKGQFVV